MLLPGTAAAKDRRAQYEFESRPGHAAALPADVAAEAGPSLSSAAADTFHLAWYSFDVNGQADPQGWTYVDITQQLATYTHVADATELDGGTYGNLLPLSGARSMWCGQPPSSEAPYCGWATLPGYNGEWDQRLCTTTLNADSVVVTYTVFWDSEPGYDWTFFEWSQDNINWTPFAVGDTFMNLGYYEGTGPHPGDGGLDGYLIETFSVGPNDGITSGSIWLRFRFTSDYAWSDRDGLWPTDGAFTVDDITVSEYASDGTLLKSTTTTFETAPLGGYAGEHGLWVGKAGPNFGNFSDLYPGVAQYQEDDCFTNITNLWAFIDDPTYTNYICHSPDPLPLQGAVPYGHDDLYLNNEIWSPRFPNVGAGNEYHLRFQVYRDLPLDNLVFYIFHVRTWNGDCPSNWQDTNFVFYGSQRDWHQDDFEVSAFISPSDAEIQIAVGAWDLCSAWCGVFGTGSCHSHAPLIDNVHLLRVNRSGPRFSVRHLDLFQDNFAEDGTLTGHARADAANDISQWSSTSILPGDSVTMTVTDIGTDQNTGIGPAVYTYVAVWPQGQAGKTGLDLEAPETRVGVGKRYPLVGTEIHDGVTWHCYRADTALTNSGSIVADRYAMDLNDWVLTPGDTVCYVFCGEDSLGGRSYFSRRLNGQGRNFITNDSWEAFNSPMEFTILPAGGWERGGDILYVDDSDDRGGPVQLYFDTAFDMLGLRDLVDRYDVLAPSSVVANSLASRVKDAITQIRNCYRKIIWCSGNLSSGTVGDGTGNPEKSDDFGLLFFFVDTHPSNPGVYFSGDDLAQEWVTLAGAGGGGWGGSGGGQGPVDFRSIYMNFNLVSGDHVITGEPVSPLLTALSPVFTHLGVPDKLIAYGGCPLINDFDLLEATGLSQPEFINGTSGQSYVLSQSTPNAAASTARVVLSGFSYSAIRDDAVGAPVDRVDHLRDILIYMQNITASPTSVPEHPEFANRLDRNFPNPFNPTTRIRYSIRTKGHVSLRVYDVTGALVTTLIDEVQAPRAEGFTVEWDGSSNGGSTVASGVYFYRLVTEGFDETKKMVLLK
jgi:hypothetical protein